MIAYPNMLIEPAKSAGIKCPNNADHFDPEEFVQFAVFCSAQLGQPNPYPGCHWDNAKVIASISEDKLKLITFDELYELGFAVGYSE